MNNDGRLGWAREIEAIAQSPTAVLRPRRQELGELGRPEERREGAGGSIPQPGADGGRVHSAGALPRGARTTPGGRGRKGRVRERARPGAGVGLAGQPKGCGSALALTAASPRRS